MRRLLIALTLAGAALRFATLDLQSFWYDESVTVDLVRHGLWGVMDRIPGSESTPPLYYVLAWLWTQVFGSGEVGIRSLSALLGTAAIPVAYLAARELARSERVGVAVAALAAFNPLLVWYSQEARTYALLMLLGGLSLLFFARLLRDFETRWLVWWAVTSALALTAHYFAGFLVVPELAWLVWRVRRREVIAAAAGVAAVGLALLPLAIHQERLALASFIKGDALAYRVLLAAKQFLIGFDAPAEVILSAVAGVIAGIGVLLGLRRGGPAAALAALGLALPALLALLGLDYVNTRNVIVAWLPFFTVIAAGLAPSRAGQAAIAALCAIGLTAVIAVDVTPAWQRDDWRGIAEALGPPRANRAIVVSPAETGVKPFRHYVPDAVPIGVKGVTVREVALVSPPAHDDPVHPPTPPRPAHPVLPGFREVRHVYAEGYTVIVFARPQPGQVTPSFLAAYRLLDDDRAGLLFEPGVSVRAARGRPPAGG